MPHSILLVGHDTLLRQGLCSLLASQGEPDDLNPQATADVPAHRARRLTTREHSILQLLAEGRTTAPTPRFEMRGNAA